MISAIGESAMQQTMRATYSGDIAEKEWAVKQAERVRKERPVEETEDGSKPELDMKFSESSKTSFEEGQIIIEKYDADGRLIRKIPPGYLPFGEQV